MSEWQPIETAPEDEPILLFCSEYKVRGDNPCKAVFEGIRFNNWSFFSVPQPDCREANWMDLNWEPTHWKPLPEPPK